MSEKTSVTNHAPKSIDTLIGAGMRIDGDIDCTGILRVQGEILGNVSCQENPNATLMVDGAGKVSGTVLASRVVVRGGIVGPVRSLQFIEVHPGGSIAGDISYKGIAIHAGGVIDGSLSPAAITEVHKAAPESRSPAPEGAILEAPAADAKPSALAARLGGGRGIAIGILVAGVVGAGIWINRNPEILGRHNDETALKSEPVLKAPEEPAPLAARTAASQDAAKPASADSPAPLAQIPATIEPEPAPPSPPESTEKNQDAVVAVRGTNPNRPPGVFLLISNEPSVLYRKKNGESGEGARIAVPAGEKVSVAIAPDELVRVAQGRDVVILYQGKKVSRNVIDSGAWISFVPK